MLYPRNINDALIRAECDPSARVHLHIDEVEEELWRLRGQFVDADVWMYQHEETGLVGFIDQWQVDNGFQKNNPRLQLICKLYRKKSGDES